MTPPPVQNNGEVLVTYSQILANVTRTTSGASGHNLNVDRGVSLTLQATGSTSAYAVVIDQNTVSLNGQAESDNTIALSALKLVSTDGEHTLITGPRINKQAVAIINHLNISSYIPTGAVQTYYTGQIDVEDNDLIVRSPDDTAASVATQQMNGYAQSGLSGRTRYGSGLGGTWTGNGLTSSLAASNGYTTSSYTPFYAVAVTRNQVVDHGTGATSALFNTFDGQTVSQNDVLAKFTYFGDADLSGNVDDTDYFLINQGYSLGLSGWLNGDFDYSGTVDDTDYFLLNTAFAHQHDLDGVVGRPMLSVDGAEGEAWWRAVITPGMPFYDESVTFFETGYWPSNPYSDLSGASSIDIGNDIASANLPEPRMSVGLLVVLGIVVGRRRKSP